MRSLTSLIIGACLVAGCQDAQNGAEKESTGGAASKAGSATKAPSAPIEVPGHKEILAQSRAGKIQLRPEAAALKSVPYELRDAFHRSVGCHIKARGEIKDSDYASIADTVKRNKRAIC